MATWPGCYPPPAMHNNPVKTQLSRMRPAGRTLVAALVIGVATQAARAENAEPLQEKAAEMVMTAMNFLGVPYKRGGSSEASGFDCSGFTRRVFGMTLGLVLPRRVDEQASAPGLVPVQPDELKPGDLVFFNTLKRTFSHVGIYIGEGKFIHSPRSGGEVRIEKMSLAYWKKRFTGARRVLSATIAPAAASALDPASVAPMLQSEAPDMPASNTQRD